MIFSFNDVRQYTIELLKGYFPNKRILNNLSESNDGKLTYKNTKVCSGESSGSSSEQPEQQSSIDFDVDYIIATVWEGNVVPEQGASVETNYLLSDGSAYRTSDNKIYNVKEN